MRMFSGCCGFVFAVFLFACLAYADGGEFAEVFKDEPGRYVYSYPSSSSFADITEENSHSGEICLRLELDHNNYSGAGYSLHSPVDASSIREKGNLQFWVKGGSGGEKFEIALVNEQNDGRKAESTFNVAMIADVSKEWQKITIPLSSFPTNAVYWDGAQGKELPAKFDWSNITELKIRTRPDPKRGKNIILYFDDVVLTAGGESSIRELSVYKEGEPLYTYTYGGKSKIEIVENIYEGKPSIKIVLDAKDYSGGAFAFGPLDLSGARARGVLEFMLKSEKGGEKVELNVVKADDPKVEVGLDLNSVKPISSDWQKYEIPLKDFPEKGLYWNPQAGREIPEELTKWDNIGELKFKIKKGENKNCVLYVSDVKIRLN